MGFEICSTRSTASAGMVCLTNKNQPQSNQPQPANVQFSQKAAAITKRPSSFGLGSKQAWGQATNVRNGVLFLFFGLFISGGFCSPLSAQQRVIQLEIHAEARAVVGTQQRWMRLLSEVGAERVVSKTSSISAPAIEETKLGQTNLITITGVIRREKLKLPGGTFTVNDQAKIRRLIQNLRDDGADVTLAEKQAFGLTANQLTDLKKTLSQPVNFKTQGLPVRQLFDRVAVASGIELTFDSTAQKAIVGAEKFEEELQGLASGTALAYGARRLGLAVKPVRRPGEKVQLALMAATGKGEFWPVGWEPAAIPLRVEPKLFERSDLEVRNYALLSTLQAIESRVGVLFLYDRQAIDQQGINLAEAKVSLVGKKMLYIVAIGKLLLQTKPSLIENLRVDDAGKPFLWIKPQ